MRRPVQFALIAVSLVLLGATLYLFQNYRRQSAEFADLKTAEQSVRASYADAFNAIAEIQDSLNVITRDAGAVHLQSDGLTSEVRLTQPNRREALESIALLSASIQRTKEKIGELESRLKKSHMKAAGLERMIANLKHSMAESQEQVAMLSARADSLQTQVASLQTTVQVDQDSLTAKDQNIENKRRELGTIYYVVGTKKELTSSGLVVAKGGVLGLGKTMQLSGRYDPSRFTPLDTDVQSVVLAPGDKLDKVHVLSQQPVSSYELVLAGNQVELHIIDPIEFRKVKHLVIMTA